MTSTQRAASDWRDGFARAVRGRVVPDEPMRAHTTLQVGGPADAWFEPADPQDLADALAYATQRQTPITVVGGGSNLLVRDGGIRGVVVHLGDAFTAIDAEATDTGARWTVGAATRTQTVVTRAVRDGLAGAEVLAGIPGSMGGALRMNAGGHHGELAGILAWAEWASPQGLARVSKEQLGLGYRTSALPKDTVVTRLGLELRHGDPEALRAYVHDHMVRRKATQPLQLPNAGSIFKNPKGDHAGRLIEAAGLKGQRLGGALVSELHANFIVNAEGSASAADVLGLAERVRATVRARSGVELELEVQVIGEPRETA